MITTSPMASSVPWEASTLETALAKRHLKFRGCNSKPGWFSEPFPGLYPTHHQRRRYVNGFLQWYFGDTHFDYIQTQLAQTADSDVVDRFIALKREPVSPSAFEFLVDQALWGLHCELTLAKSVLYHHVSNINVNQSAGLLRRISLLGHGWEPRVSLEMTSSLIDSRF